MRKKKLRSRWQLEEMAYHVDYLTDGDLASLIGFLVAETQNRANEHGFRISAVDVLTEAMATGEAEALAIADGKL